MIISPEQMRMLHGTAAKVGFAHDDIRDEANVTFGVESLKDLTTDQASHLIEHYLSQAEPPEPPEPAVVGRFNFMNLPKRVKPMPAIQGFITPMENYDTGGVLIVRFVSHLNMHLHEDKRTEDVSHQLQGQPTKGQPLYTVCGREAPPRQKTQSHPEGIPKGMIIERGTRWPTCSRCLAILEPPTWTPTPQISLEDAIVRANTGRPPSLFTRRPKPKPVVAAPAPPVVEPTPVTRPAYKSHRKLTPDGRLSCGNEEVDKIPW